MRRWEKIRAGARNEALDVRVYNMAALAILNPNWRALARRAADKLAADLRTAVEAVETAAAAEEPGAEGEEPEPDREPEGKRPRKRLRRRGQRGWATNW